jgi:hypothetical protein
LQITHFHRFLSQIDRSVAIRGLWNTITTPGIEKKTDKKTPPMQVQEVRYNVRKFARKANASSVPSHNPSTKPASNGPTCWNLNMENTSSHTRAENMTVRLDTSIAVRAEGTTT